MGRKTNKNTPEEDFENDLPDMPREDAVGFADGEDGVIMEPTIETPQTANASTEDLQAQLAQAKKDELYLRAEFDNYRRQAIKERSQLMRYGGEGLARDLLETLDIFEKALEGGVTPENFKDFAQGIHLTAQQLRSTLNKHGINEVPSQGLAFDPSVHEALASEPTEEVPAGHISQVFKKPYKYHDKILRTGQVIVAKPTDS